MLSINSFRYTNLNLPKSPKVIRNVLLAGALCISTWACSKDDEPIEPKQDNVNVEIVDDKNEYTYNIDIHV